MIAKDKPITANAIAAGLIKRFAAPEWALFCNVANGTGARTYRYADAVGMSLFPSRGLEIHGFEIKISKSDYRREAADPAKAETIAAYCDRWFIVTPPNLLENEVIPPEWGWLAYDGRAFYNKKAAGKTDAKPIDRAFLAAILRRAHEQSEALASHRAEERTAELTASTEVRIANEVAMRSRKFTELKERVDKFEELTGIEIDDWHPIEGIAQAVAVVKATGITDTYQRAETYSKQLRRIADDVDRAIAGVTAPSPTPQIAKQRT